MHKPIACLALSLLCACTTTPQSRLERAGGIERIRVSDRVEVSRKELRLRYRGEMTEEGLAALKTLADGRDIRLLEIDSAGGEIVVGMDFGLWVHDRGIDVAVDRACLSSCANYVFPAGRRKIIAPGAVVAWHGSARQQGLLDQLHRSVEEQIGHRAQPAAQRARALAEAREANVAYLTGAILKQGEFFHRIGVDEYVTRVGNEAYGVRGFFYLSVQDMARFGIDNVIAPEDYPRMDPRALARRAGFPVTYVELTE